MYESLKLSSLNRSKLIRGIVWESTQSDSSQKESGIYEAMENLVSYLDKREAEIMAVRSDLAAELKQIRKVRAVIGVESRFVGQSLYGSKSKLTIKKMIIEILEKRNSQQKGGFTTVGLIRAIEKLYGVDVERSSISPQLSRLKKENKIVIDNDKIWTLKENELKVIRTSDSSRIIETGRGKRPPPVSESNLVVRSGATPKKGVSHVANRPVR